jgi:hypothetical protein
VSPDSQERLIEVSEKSVVLELGIQLQSDGLALELVSSVITVELKSTRRSIELVLVPLMVSRTTLPQKLMSMKRTSLLLEASLIMVLSTTISLCSRAALWEPKRDLYSLERVF